MFLCFYFLNYILLIMVLKLSHFFLPFIPPCPAPPFHQHTPPPQFMSTGHAYKFFGFSISYTILNLPCLFCTYHLCFLFPVPFPHSPPSPSPLITLHVLSISAILFLFQLFAQFVFVLGSVVDSFEFVVILLFIVLIFFFLDKSLLTFHIIRAQ